MPSSMSTPRASIPASRSSSSSSPRPQPTSSTGSWPRSSSRTARAARGPAPRSRGRRPRTRRRGCPRARLRLSAMYGRAWSSLAAVERASSRRSAREQAWTADRVLEPVARALELVQAGDEQGLELALADQVRPEQPEQHPSPEAADPARYETVRPSDRLGPSRRKPAAREPGVSRVSRLGSEALELRHALGEEGGRPVDRLPRLDRVPARAARARGPARGRRRPPA